MCVCLWGCLHVTIVDHGAGSGVHCCSFGLSKPSPGLRVGVRESPSPRGRVGLGILSTTQHERALAWRWLNEQKPKKVGGMQ